MNDDPETQSDEEEPKEGPPPPPPTTGEGVASTPGDAFTGGITGLVTKLFAFLGTGAGFLTFVALTGAAITWVRFAVAQLPADQAVGLVPRDDLIDVGSVAMMTFGVLGLSAVAVVYAIDAPGRLTDGMRGGLSVLVTAELIALILMADYGGEARKIAASVAMSAIGAMGVALLMFSSPEPPEKKGVRAWFTAGFRKKATPIPPTSAELAAYEKRRKLDPAAQQPAPKDRTELTGKAIALAAIATLLTAIALGLWFHAAWVAATAALACVLAGICLAVARVSGDRFWPYAIAVFFSVVLFGAAANTAEFATDPKLNPVALLRAGNHGPSGVVGLLVARTDDRYWLGNVTVECEQAKKQEDKEYAAENLIPSNRIEPGSGRIFAVPRAQILDDEIGTWTEPLEAGRRSEDLLRELVKRQPPAAHPCPRRPNRTAT